MAPEETARYILVAEDSESDLFLVREALRAEKVDWRLHVIADGEAAIAFIEQMDVDLNQLCPEIVLLDLHLPKQDGETILKRLRASDRCANIPVVVLTSSLSAEDKRNVERHPPVHFFRKPTSLVEFMELGLIVKSAIAGGAAI
jgi:CheY-like chemotaxis protein